jgi:2-succinyl-5-enolpyruvyl-6-hydroxy-3-cyclohexene-1-carboxylate synthase
MIPDSPNINILWTNLIINELARNGITYFCISPGSRSTPLVVAVAQNRKAQTIVCFDERGAAFHALGYARATGNPAVVISTSGTAAANFYPAVVEASQDCVPLLVFTADRPPELRFTGANQTIDQVHLYGNYLRWQYDMPCPDEKIPPEMVLTTIDHALYHAVSIPKGPVHINCMFREPLAPDRQDFSKSYVDPIATYVNGKKPYTDYGSDILSAGTAAITAVSDTIKCTKRGMFVVGRLDSDDDRDAVTRLVKKLQWPVFADITSGMKLSSSLGRIMCNYDRMLLSDKYSVDRIPDTILHVGGQPTSKHFLHLLESNKIQNYIIVKNHPYRHDPAHKATVRITSGIQTFCDQLCANPLAKSSQEWLDEMRNGSQKAENAIERLLSGYNLVSEPSIARNISQNISENSGLFLGSSMPVRDMNMFAASCRSSIPVAANRGASGIDGTIAAAAGYAAGLDTIVTLIIGDIAFIHDINSLTQLKNISKQLIIVLLNNKGGGIFSFLPIAGFPEVFEEYFGTPHEYTFRKTAEQFDCDYYNPKTMKEFETTYKSALNSGFSTIIEVETDRKKNRDIHREIDSEIVKELER